MDDLVQWLREQIAETGRLAKAAHPGPWEWSDRGWQGRLTANEPGFYRIATVPENDAREGEWDWLHIALNDPHAALAQCDAHVAILDRCVRLREVHCSDDFTAYWFAEDVTKTLALAYRHRPGYREEWRP